MTVEISDRDLIRLLQHSFHHSDFDTVGIEVDASGLHVFSVDRSSTIVGSLTVPPSLMKSFEISEPRLTTVDAEALENALSVPDPADLVEPEFNLALKFGQSFVEIVSKIGTRYVIKRTLRDIPSGVRRLPSLPDFTTPASCRVENTQLLRQVSTTMSDYRDLEVRIEKNQLSFARPSSGGSDAFMVLNVPTEGKRVSRFSRGHIEAISRVHQVRGLTALDCELSEGGFGRFEYSYDDASLYYVVAPAIDR